MIKRIHYGCIQFLFWTLLLIAISVTGFRLALAQLDLFKIEIESRLSQQLDAQVSITKLRGKLNVFSPELVLYGMTVQTLHHKKSAIQLKEVHFKLDLLATLIHPLLESLQISIIGAKLSIKRLKSGVIAIQGLPTDNTETPSWLMQGMHYRLIDSDINWQDEKRNTEAVQLEHVNITIENKNQRHKIFIAVDLPETLGHSLNLAMDFSGNLFVPDSIDARLFIQGKKIQLAKIMTGDLPFDFTINKGLGDFSLWSHWQATQMTRMQGSIQMSDAEITGQQNPPFAIEQLELQFALQKQQQHWYLGIQQSHISSQQTDLKIPQLAIALQQNEDGHLTHIALNCPQLDLGQLSKLLTRNKILPENLHKQIQKLGIKGQIEDLLFMARPLEESFAINAQLQQIHNNATKDIPGINGLSLYINGTEQLGNIHLNSQQLDFNAPELFREPLHFNHILGKLNWQQQTDHWIFSSAMLELQTADIKTKNKFSLTLPKDKQPANLSLQSYFYDGPDASQIPHYLPVGAINNPALVKWLDHAFLAGNIDQGELVFRGALNDYPFTQSQGVIELLFNVKNVDFHYADNWHLVENLNAEVRFFAESLAVNIHHGLANQAIIKQASILINSFTHSDTFSVQGDIQGDLTQAIDFLKQTPYREQITTLNNLLTIQGLFSADIDIEISMIDHPAKMDIMIIPQNAQMYLSAANLPVTEINGTLHITEQGIASKNLTASILGYSVTTKISSKQQNSQLFVSGQTDIPQLSRQFPNPIWSYLTGASAYQLHVDIPHDSHKYTSLQLISDLEGIAIDFPPLSKSVGQAHPFSLDLSMDTLGINALNFNYKDQLNPENSLDINLKKINPHWQGLIHSPFANGSLFIPIDFNKNTEISFFCDTLNLSALESIHFKMESTSIAMHDMPDLHLESKAIYWNNNNLGNLKLITKTTPEGLQIKQLKIVSTDTQLDLSGYWQQNQSSNIHTSSTANPTWTGKVKAQELSGLINFENLTIITGNLLSSKFGKLLQQLELSENTIDSTAEFQFSLNWPDTPLNFSRKILSGDIQAHLKNGRILDVEPGFGRILGALDTQKLFKRLRFDFSDITEKGLSFSDITANIAISHGLAKTDNLNINAMPAKINMTGTAQLQTKEVDLLATVLPKLPIAGTIIGSIANKVTKTVVGKQHAGGVILSLLYKITGTWEHPEVNRQFSPTFQTK